MCSSLKIEYTQYQSPYLEDLNFILFSAKDLNNDSQIYEIFYTLSKITDYNGHFNDSYSVYSHSSNMTSDNSDISNILTSDHGNINFSNSEDSSEFDNETDSWSTKTCNNNNDVCSCYSSSSSSSSSGSSEDFKIPEKDELDNGKKNNRSKSRASDKSCATKNSIDTLTRISRDFEGDLDYEILSNSSPYSSSSPSNSSASSLSSSSILCGDCKLKVDERRKRLSRPTMPLKYIKSSTADNNNGNFHERKNVQEAMDPRTSMFSTFSSLSSTPLNRYERCDGTFHIQITPNIPMLIDNRENEMHRIRYSRPLPPIPKPLPIIPRASVSF